MSIGIIGSGAIGAAFARVLTRTGIEATISNSRGPESLSELVREVGPSIKAGSREEAARADIVFVAVNWTKLSAALAGLPEWSGRIIIDANNPIEAPLFKPIDLKGRVSSEFVADLVPGARVVKAFNHLRAEMLAADPRSGGGRRVLFYSGNDSAAKAEVAVHCQIKISSSSPESPLFAKRPDAAKGDRRRIGAPEAGNPSGPCQA
ncbi:NADPH-dependent F420 reductase [Bradyrhizobium sp. AUGA SZCCT0431]|uniref:NADPH-dependent F420 reductase n=1 Tax=Bradyrhizobium sp. AUGA SZCCT0431 TaxID=2807674 RepID=UPI001BAC18F3|nr:NAD(P)-binding domain-containing protein [Bradyrhizobium sp. AUGA SZCCT0431]MBR1144243.1 NAD(P)-binding domain-containing protein [Bradyrhizobium sp. AUGA SZCCT0431]